MTTKRVVVGDPAVPAFFGKRIELRLGQRPEVQGDKKRCNRKYDAKNYDAQRVVLKNLMQRISPRRCATDLSAVASSRPMHCSEAVAHIIRTVPTRPRAIWNHGLR